MSLVALLAGALGLGVGLESPASAASVPDAVDDTYFAEGVFTVFPPGPMTNDVTADGGGAMTMELVDSPDHLFLTEFTPEGYIVGLNIEGFRGIDTMTYVVHQTVGESVVTSEPATITVILGAPFATTLDVDPLVLQLGGPSLLRLRVGSVSATLTSELGPLADQTIAFASGAPARPSATP